MALGPLKAFKVNPFFCTMKSDSAVKIAFWLLDVNHQIRENVPEIWLWGVDDSGKRVLVIDREFHMYFWAIIEENATPERVAEEIERLQNPTITKLEIAERRFFGKPVKAVKIYCKNPDEVSKCARSIRETEGVKDCLEDDIRYTMRYIIDNDVVTCGWHEVEAIEEPLYNGVQVDKIYIAGSSLKPVERSTIPRLRSLGFSIICYSREGSPKPDRNPVILISVATNSGEEKQFEANEDKNDKEALKSFIDYVRSFDPDILAAYGANWQDWPYLKQRCEKLGLSLRIGRTETEPHQSVYGHFSVTGRANIDLSDYAEDYSDVKVKTLANLADYLGVMKLEDRVIIEEVDFPEYWDSREKHGTLKTFSTESTRCVMGIADLTLDFAIQLSSIVGLPLDHVGTAAASFRVEWFIMKRVHKIGELAPKRVEQPYRPYAGGIVVAPKPGLHENVADLDFKSMYPNIMIKYNLSPDTYLRPDEPAPTGGVNEAPEVKHRFRRSPAGFYKDMLSYLINIRDDAHSRMKLVSPRNVEYRVLDARQRVLKIITNAAYGYAGWTGARWYVKPVAEAAAAWGRYTIKTAMEMAEEKGLKIVYGDTDSIFVEYDREKIENLSRNVQKKLGLEIKPDKIYTRILFTEAKKRYAGLLPDGRLDIVGLEVMRGDWAEVAKKVQEKVLEIMLKEKSPKKAVTFVQNFIYELRQRRVPCRDLIIWKTLTKPAEEYEVKASHVEAAKLLKEKGWELAVGDKVGYVVVVGSGRLYEKVKPYMFASYAEVDIEYYVTKQIVPVVTRILEPFGVAPEELSESRHAEKETKSLTDFFGS
ncbi:DNA polymerase II [Candidatus Bathyarchaeota archaeon]|nr:DNA polymerase II [Candidatus Bathyarchaeota archaeon]